MFLKDFYITVIFRFLTYPLKFFINIWFSCCVESVCLFTIFRLTPLPPSGKKKNRRNTGKKSRCRRTTIPTVTLYNGGYKITILTRSSVYLNVVLVVHQTKSFTDVYMSGHITCDTNWMLIFLNNYRFLFLIQTSIKSLLRYCLRNILTARHQHDGNRCAFWFSRRIHLLLYHPWCV